MSELLVERPGAFTIVVDRGRIGYRDIGVAWCGPMDKRAFDAANAMVGNGDDAAALEITLGNATFRFDAHVEFALAGAACDAHLNGTKIEIGSASEAGPGSHLQLGMPASGLRTYLAVRGGIDVPLVMGSRTTDTIARFGGHFGRALTAGDKLRLGAVERSDRRVVSPAAGTGQVRLALIGEQHHFSAESLQRLFATTWTVGHESNRMGYRLEGAALKYEGPELHSHAVFPGIVQVPPNGNPIVLMADAQTTGGYPKIGFVAPEDLGSLAQLRPGDKFTFTRWTA